MSRGWEDAEDEVIKADWADGLSASQISRKLTGRSRNAVLGRVFRLGLAQRSPARVTRERVKRNDPRVAKVLAKIHQAKIDSAEDPGPADPPIDTMALRDHHCKWPYDVAGGGYHYCGQSPKKGRPWCPYHCDKARQPSNRTVA